MRAPGFWQKDRSIMGALLSPLGALYAAGTARRLARGIPQDVGVPVICVGNLSAGGTGKTPTVIALVERLIARGHAPQVVSKGYGGSLEGPIQVDPLTHSADHTGDEPLLIAAFCPVWVAKDRVAGAQAAVQAGADVILLDDGHQDPSLRKALSLVVSDAARGFGNGRVIPAGPLREPVAKGLARADGVITLGPAPMQRRFTKRHGSQITLPHLQAELTPLPTGMPWAGMRAMAFAGIGYPDKFFASLRQAGVDVVRTLALSDHQPLEPKLMQRLLAEARDANAQLVTTEKDAVRLPPDLRAKILPFPVRLTFADEAALSQILQRAGL